MPIEKKRLTVLLSIVAIILFSCTPAPEAATIARFPLSSSGFKIEIDNSYSREINVSFPPIKGADEYGIELWQMGNIEVPLYDVPVDLDKNFSSGLFTVNIGGLKPETLYKVVLTVSSKAGGSPLTIESSVFSTKSMGDSAPDGKPTAWLESLVKSGGTFTANIVLDVQDNIEYRLYAKKKNGVLDPDAVPVEIPLEEGKPYESGEFSKAMIFSLEELTPESIIYVAHGRKNRDTGAINWSHNMTEITFPDNVEIYDPAFTLGITDGKFHVEGAGSGKDIALYRYTETDGPIWQETVKADDKGNASFGEDERNNLSSGIWFATNGEKVSHALFHTSGPIVDVKADQKSITLSWTEPEGLSVFYSGIPEPEKDGAKRCVTFTGLDSDTAKDFTIRATFADGRTAEKVVNARTESFEGVYAWYDTTGSKKAVPNFIVSVEKAPEGSDYGYYIYTHEDDAKNVNDKSHDEMRLMPLVDPKLDRDIPTDFVKIKGDKSDFTKAYMWNESKWNSTSMHPAYWKPGTVEISRDEYHSTVDTKAMGMLIVTATDFTFFVAPDGSPMLRFKNKAVSGSTVGIVNNSLYKNMAPREELGEDEFTYALKRIGGLEK